jgi:SAM-dependent methyltransferase
LPDPRKPKVYDRAYFRRWYHDPRTRISSVRVLERKVHLAVSAAEYLLGRRIRSVLDVGCGEATWYDVLKEMRRPLAYTGVDSSAYVVRARRADRRVRLGSFGELRTLRLARGFDLIVCADVLQYVPTRELARGLREMGRLLGGVAYIEAFTRDDDMEGDMDGWHFRSAAEYRRLFRGAGLTRCGLNCFVDRTKIKTLNELETL